jgi:hypothetical protein
VALFLCLGSAQAQTGASSAPSVQIGRAESAIEAAKQAGAKCIIGSMAYAMSISHRS